MKRKIGIFKIEPIGEEDMDEVTHMCNDIFKEHDTMASDPLLVELSTQISVSYKALLDSKIIGCYLMSEDPIIFTDDFILFEDLNPYSQKKGIHGVVLALKPDYRGLGFGRQLRDLPLISGKYDFVWGGHVKSLNNLNHWTRYGRRVVGESKNCYLTLMDLTKSVI